MNKKAKQLRSLRNKLIYNGDVPLEFNCRLLRGSEEYIIIDVWTNTKGVDYNFIVRSTYNNHQHFEVRNEELYREYEILGKPTSWGDVLRMLNKNKDFIAVFTMRNGDSLFLNENQDDEIELDLTKDPEEQDEEVLEKLIELIK